MSVQFLAPRAPTAPHGRRSSMLARFARAVSLSLTATVLVACSDEGEDAGAGGATTSTTAAASTAQATSSASRSASSSTTAATSTGSGGAAACLPAADHPEIVLPTGELCVTARFVADELLLDPYGTTPTWGAHDGLLTYAATPSGIRIEAWSMGLGGLLAPQTHEVTLTSVPADAYLSPVLVTGASGQYALSWTGADFANEGGIVFLSEQAELGSVDATGVTGFAGRGIGGSGFFAYTGLSAVGGPHQNRNAAYVFSATGATPVNAAELEAWGNASGPATFDADGNLVAVTVDFIAGTQEIRGFHATASGVAAEGASLATIPGYGDALAALRPRAGQPGIVAFQPNDPTDQKHLDVVGQHYTDDGTTLVPQGAPSTLVDVVGDDVNVTLTNDTHDRIWLGLSGGQLGALFLVLARTD